MKNKIYLSILIAAAVVGGGVLGFVYNRGQNRGILTDYSSNEIPDFEIPTVEGENEKTAPINLPNQAEELGNDLKSYVKNFSGTIKEIKQNTLIVEAKVPDLLSLQKLDYSRSIPIPMITKVYTVFIDSRTIFPQKQLSDFRIADLITVFSSEPILEKNQILATAIIKS